MGKTEVVDADLAQYFDTIPHQQLLRQVARRVSDGAILKLIKAWLRAPIMEEEEGGRRKMKANACGTPQGGVISPLLANIYLHPLDEGVNDRCQQKPRMIRYADDLVIDVACFRRLHPSGCLRQSVSPLPSRLGSLSARRRL